MSENESQHKSMSIKLFTKVTGLLQRIRNQRNIALEFNKPQQQRLLFHVVVLFNAKYIVPTMLR